MKKLGLVAFALLFCLLSYGQDSRYIQFKLYKNMEFGLGQTAGTRTAELGTFSPAIAWGRTQNFHEVQLISLNFFSRAQARNYSAGLEYSYNYCFTDDKTQRVQTFLGGGIGANFTSNYSELLRNSAVAVATRGTFIDVHLVVIPRITINLKKNILLDLSLPYQPFLYENSVLSENDPALPDNAQTTTFNETSFFPRAISLKVGAIVKF